MAKKKKASNNNSPANSPVVASTGGSPNVSNIPKPKPGKRKSNHRSPKLNKEQAPVEPETLSISESKQDELIGDKNGLGIPEGIMSSAESDPFGCFDPVGIISAASESPTSTPKKSVIEGRRVQKVAPVPPATAPQVQGTLQCRDTGDTVQVDCELSVDSLLSTSGAAPVTPKAAKGQPMLHAFSPPSFVSAAATILDSLEAAVVVLNPSGDSVGKPLKAMIKESSSFVACIVLTATFCATRILYRVARYAVSDPIAAFSWAFLFGWLAHLMCLGMYAVSLALHAVATQGQAYLPVKSADRAIVAEQTALKLLESAKGQGYGAQVVTFGFGAVSMWFKCAALVLMVPIEADWAHHVDKML